MGPSWIQEDAEMTPVTTQIQERRHGCHLGVVVKGTDAVLAVGTAAFQSLWAVRGQGPQAWREHMPRCFRILATQTVGGTWSDVARGHSPSHGSAAWSSCSILACLGFLSGEVGVSVMSVSWISHED